MRIWVTGVGLAIALACCGPALAVNDPDELMPGKVGIVKPANLGKFVSKPATAFALPSASITSGTLQLFDTTNPGAGANSYPLTAGTWIGLGNPAGSKGWKYKGTKTSGDPCNVVLIKTAVVKGVCKGAGVTLAPPFAGNLGVILTVGPGGTQKRYCATFGGTPVKNDAVLFKRTNALAPGSCPTISAGTTTTSSTITATTTTTSSTMGASCCAPQRNTLTSSAGTLTVDNLAPFPFPPGIITSMDTGATVGTPADCKHPVVVPANGFKVPHFDIPALNYCSEIITLGCETGTGLGAGFLWDGNGTAGVAMVNVNKNGDTSDGVCGTLGTGCVTTAGGAGADTLGDVDETVSVSPGGGVRSVLDIKARSRTWSDSVCSPAITPGCCITSNYGDDTAGNGELLITLFDFILSPTTGTSTAAFVDKNSDGCRRAGSGFNNPGPDGPKSLTGTAATGPCCTVGQSTKVVTLGIGFSGGAPLFDLGFQNTIPNTVSACGAAGSGTCSVVTANNCLK